MVTQTGTATTTRQCKCCVFSGTDKPEKHTTIFHHGIPLQKSKKSTSRE